MKVEVRIILDWGKTAERLHFGYNEPTEFLIALQYCAQFEHLKSFAKEIQFVLDEELIRMVETANMNISKHVRAEMTVFFGEKIFYEKLDYVIVKLFIQQREQLRTSEDFLAVYRAKPAIELVAHLAAVEYADENMTWLKGHDWETIAKDEHLLYQLVVGSELPDPADHAALLEFIRYPEEYKQRTLFVMEQFHRHAYLPMRDRLQELCKAGAAKYEALFKEQPERAIRDIAKMDMDVIDKEIEVYVSYFAQVRIGIYRDERVGYSHFVVLGVNNDAFAWQREDKETIERFLKVIADKRRMELIALLHHKDYYGNELAQVMGLTPAAINYHTNMLFDLDVIQLIRVDNRIYYRLDKQKIGYYWEQTKRVLLP